MVFLEIFREVGGRVWGKVVGVWSVWLNKLRNQLMNFLSGGRKVDEKKSLPLGYNLWHLGNGCEGMIFFFSRLKSYLIERVGGFYSCSFPSIMWEYKKKFNNHEFLPPKISHWFLKNTKHCRLKFFCSSSTPAFYSFCLFFRWEILL